MLLKKMAEVLLIFPPYTLKEEFGNLSQVGNMLPPLGIAYLGAVLEKAGYQVRIIDAPPLGWKTGRISAEVKKDSFDLIGLSASTVSYPKAVRLAKKLKKASSAPIVIGGPHVTALPKEVMKMTCFDYGVVGEGEETMVELVKALMEKQDLKKIDGLVFREKGRIIKTNPRRFIEDLDSLPFPARHLMPPLSLYHPTPATFRQFPVGTMITSRGCPNRCSFCFRGVFGNRWRFRTPANIVKEIEILVNEFGAKEIRLWDDTFNVDQNRVMAICDLLIKKGVKVPWTCLGRVNYASRAMLKLMKKAGCWQISYGIESGNEAVLKRANKGISKEMVRKAIRETYRAGIQSLGFFILGLPGETKATMNETIEFANQLPLNAANFTIATPYPGTDIWFLAKEQGFLKNLSYDKLMVNLPKKLYYVPEGMDEATLIEYEKKAYKRFYRHSAFILRQLKEIKDLSELARKLRAFLTIQKI